VKREEKREIKARMLAGENVAEIQQDEKFRGREAEVEEASKRYIRLSLAVKGMSYQEIAKRELQAKGITELDEESVKRISRDIMLNVSKEHLTETIQSKKKEMERRLKSGESVEDIVADRELNVCQEAVEIVQEQVQVQEKQSQKPPRKRLTQEEKDKVREQLLAGKTVEEISQMKEFQGLSQEGIQKSVWVARAIQLESYEKLKELSGIPGNGIYGACRYEQVKGKPVIEIRREKTEQLRRCLQEKTEDETLEGIAQELSVVVEAVQSMWEEMSKKNSKPAKARKPQLTTQDEEKIFAYFVAGKSLEEVCKMEEFGQYPKELIEQFYQRKDWMVQAIRLVPYAKIAEDTGRKKSTIQVGCAKHKIQGMTISQIRMKKQKALSERLQTLQENEQIEDVANELEIDVEFAKTMQAKMKKVEKKPYQKEEIVAIVEQMLLGKTPEEIGQMEAFRQYSIESIQEVCQAGAWTIQAVQLVPCEKIAAEIGKHTTQVYRLFRDYQVGGKNIAQIRKEKKEQVMLALQEEKTPEEIAANLMVDLAVVQEYQQTQKPQEKRDERKDIHYASNEEKDKVTEQVLAGKSIEEIQAMEEFRGYAPKSLAKFYQEKQWIVQALSLLPYQDIASQKGVKLTTLRALASSTNYQGKSVSQLRREKEEELEERLQKGENVESLAQELGVDIEVAKAMQGQIELKQRKQQEKEAKREAKSQAVKLDKKEVPPQLEPVASRKERKQAVEGNRAYLRMRIMQGKYQSKKKR